MIDLEFVRKIIIGKYGGRLDTHLIEDLVQEGLIGYWKALQNYKEGTEVPFNRYAASYVRGYARHFLRDKSNVIKTPRMQDRYVHFPQLLTERISVQNLHQNLIVEDDLTSYGGYLSHYFETLTQDEKITAILLYQSYTTYEIAKMTSVSQTAVVKRIKRVREKVRQVIDNCEVL